jgi:hypothetical protein
MEHLKPRTLYPIEEVTPLDHQIRHAGGSTSTLERLPSRLHVSKNQRSMSLRDEMEELVYENSYLKAELAWNQETRHALMELQDKVCEATSMMREALAQANFRLKESEERYLELWGVGSGKEGGVI